MELYSILSKIFLRVTDTIILNIHVGTKEIFGNGFFQGAFILFAIFYLVQKIAKAEEFSRRDIYPILIWCVWFYSVSILVTNQKAYLDFLNLFQIPRNVFTYLVLKLTGGQNQPADILESLYVALSATQSVLDQADGSWFSFNFVGKTLSIIFFLISLLLIIVLAFILILSSLIARIILSFGAFMLICLIWSKTRGYFFSWLKLYISFSLYAPLGILIGVVALEFGKFASSVSIEMGKTETLNLAGITSVIVGMVLCIFLLLKIPNIINGIIGTSNDSTTGASGIIGFIGGVAGGSLSSLMNRGKQYGGELINGGYRKLKEKFGSRSGVSEGSGVENTLDSESIHS